MNPDYLRAVADAVRLFKAEFERFLELNVINEGTVGRGILPAVMLREGADSAEVARRQAAVAQAAGRASDAPRLANIYIHVQGAPYPIDPFAAWLTVTKPKPVLEASDVLDACDQAIGRLEGKALKAEAELPPKIGVSSMHPLIWGAAGRLWRDEHYRQAVAAAAETLVTHVKSLTGRFDVAETPLWQETFSDREPVEGKPRLRWPGNAADRDVKAMNDGLRFLAPGIQMTIRNSAAHGLDAMSEQEALERLATLSLLARWIDECELQSVPS
jgi:hypothetical protein